MLSGRNCLILGTAALGLVVIDGCWVNSSTGGATAGGASSVAGAAPAAGGSSAGSAPVAMAGTNASGGASAGSTAAGGTAAGGTSAGGTSAGGTSAGGTSAGGTSAGGTSAGGTGAGTFPPAGCNAPTGTHPAAALVRTCWKAVASDCAATAANMNPAENALDASTTTRFSTGLKMVDKIATGSGFTYVVNMSSAVMISGIKMDTTAATDSPPQFEVEVSTDGTTWKPAACGTGGAISVDVSFPAVSAQYVRVTQFGPGTGWWSMTDFNVYGALGTENACAAAAGTGATGTCTTPHTT